MKQYVKIGLAVCLAGILVLALCYRKTILLVYRSVRAFDEENLAHSFQTMYEIQPSVKIKKGEAVSGFEYDLRPLMETFQFRGHQISVKDFLEETKTSGLLVAADDKITFEQYFLGADETTRFSSNSICKSFVSALVGIAIEEGKIHSVDDPVAAYVSEFKDTEMEEVTIKDCLQMSSGIAFDEEKDMGKISLSSMFGKSKMKSILKFGLAQKPGTCRAYSSINTDILGEVVARATNKSLSAYLEEKIWSQIGVEHDAYWTLSHHKEVANGGLHISLRDYARFAKLYLDNGVFAGKQIISESYIADSLATKEPHLKAPNDGKPYSEFGYGYQWWIPEGTEREFTAIGVFGQWIYVNPEKRVIIVKTGADAGFEEDEKEKKTLAFFRKVSDSIGVR